MASAALPRNEKPVPFDHVVGIDTHRDFHVAVVLAANGGKLGKLTFPTSSKGYEQLLTWSEQFGVSRSELIASCASFRPGVQDGPMAAAKRALRRLELRTVLLRRSGADGLLEDHGAPCRFQGGDMVIGGLMGG